MTSCFFRPLPLVQNSLLSKEKYAVARDTKLPFTPQPNWRLRTQSRRTACDPTPDEPDPKLGVCAVVRCASWGEDHGARSDINERIFQGLFQPDKLLCNSMFKYCHGGRRVGRSTRGSRVNMMSYDGEPVLAVGEDSGRG